MSEEVGAIPGALIAWPSSVQGETGPLNSAAGKLNSAIEALNSAPKTGGLMGPVPYAGNAILGYVARNQVIDAWVGRVGTAFLRAAEASGPVVGGGGFLATLLTDFEDLGRRATSTNAAIAAEAGSNPTREADDAASGAETGAQMKEGVDTRNQSMVDGALGTLGQHQGDGVFDVHFFQALTPKGTLAAVPFVAKAPNGLQTFDTALANATNSSGWDRAFNAALFKPDPKTGTLDRNSLGLLVAGKYSLDFLTQAGDGWLFRAQLTGDRGFATLPILQAMARNPAAASAWLTGSTPGIPGSRIGALLSTQPQYSDWQSLTLNDPGIQQAFNNLLTQIAGLKNNAPQLSTILHAIVPQNGSASDFALGLQPGTLSIVEQHINLFVPANPNQGVPATWSWQESLFKFVESAGTGKIDPNAVKGVQTAITQWGLAHAPHTFTTATASNVTTWQQYLRQVGALWGLSALPVRQAPYDAAALRSSEVSAVSDIIGLIPFANAVPGEHAIIQLGVGEGAELLDEVGTAVYQSHGGSPDQQAVPAEYQAMGAMNLALATQFLAAHPHDVPKGADRTQWIKEMAMGNIPAGAPASLAQFESDLGNADSTFLQTYNNPARGGS